MSYDASLFKAICEKYNIRMLTLFGSRAGDNFTDESDYDFGILLKNDNVNYEELLKEFMAVVNHQSVDLVILNHADPVLKFEIISNYKLLFAENDEVFLNFYTNTVKQYNDAKKLLKFEDSYLKDYIRGQRDGSYKCSPPKIN